MFKPFYGQRWIRLSESRNFARSLPDHRSRYHFKFTIHTTATFGKFHFFLEIIKTRSPISNDCWRQHQGIFVANGATIWTKWTRTNIILSAIRPVDLHKIIFEIDHVVCTRVLIINNNVTMRINVLLMFVSIYYYLRKQSNLGLFKLCKKWKVYSFLWPSKLKKICANSLYKRNIVANMHLRFNPDCSVKYNA